ncbi:MAG TPA: DUF3617 domain-containing protein [Burkholderiaceae bacterium]|nr:DUF3617 domain-containing protein [Burkholderiaceae bacterium]
MKLLSYLAAATLTLATAAAGAQTLKPGLWEITQKMGSNPQMDQAMAQMQQQMASMPPAQRKQMEEMMAKQGVQMGGGGPGGASVKVCMSKEMVERNDIAANQGDCKTTSQQRSGNTMKMAYTCTKPPSSGEGEFTFVSAEAYRSKMTVSSMAQGKLEKMTIEGSGKWLGADCGAIKPMEPPKK